MGLPILAAVLCATGAVAQDGATPAPAATPEATAASTPETTPPGPTPVAVVTPAAAPRLIYPAQGLPGTASPHPGNPTAATANLATTFLVLLGFCAGGYYLLRRQPGFTAGLKGGTRKLNVSESRSLGNRQFLVVVEYENERMLLGVTPGKIDYLCPLRAPGNETAVFPVPGGMHP